MTDKIKNTNVEKNIFCFPLLLSDTIIVDTEKYPVQSKLSMTITFRFDKKNSNLNPISPSPQDPKRNLAEKERFLSEQYEIGRPSSLEFELDEKSIKNLKTWL